MVVLLIVTPTLGQSPFLGATLHSVRELKIDVVHVVVCPGDMAAIVQRQCRDALVVTDRGRGMYDAINVGIQSAQSLPWTWFTFINDDDVLYSAFGKMCQLTFQNAFGNPDIIYGDVDVISSEGRVVYRCPVAKSVVSVPSLWRVGITPFTQQGSLVKRDWVERLHGFDSRYSLAADMDFWCRAAKQGARHVYYAEVVAGFRVRIGQLSEQQEKFSREKYDIRNRYFDFRKGRWKSLYHVVVFRLQNLSSYIHRFFRHGFKRANQFFGEC